jgi:hypothetical protein
MEDLQLVMDELLSTNPEFTFWETCAELVKKGDLNFEATQDPNVHTFLFQLFQKAKVRSLTGRVNKDI